MTADVEIYGEEKKCELPALRFPKRRTGSVTSYHINPFYRSETIGREERVQWTFQKIFFNFALFVKQNRSSWIIALYELQSLRVYSFCFIFFNDTMRFTHVIAPPTTHSFLSRFRTLFLCIALCAVLVGMQGCKDPLEGDIPRQIELTSGWEKINTGLRYGSIIFIGKIGSTLIAQTNVGSNQILRSTDEGLTWLPYSKAPMIGGVFSISGCILGTHESLLFAGTYSRLWKSSDMGYTWSEVDIKNSGITLVESVPLFSNGSILIVGGKILSSDNGVTWSILPYTFTSFTSIGTTIVALSNESRIYTSADNGKTWLAQSIVNELKTDRTNIKLCANKDMLFAFNTSGILRSTDSGKTWMNISPPKPVNLSRYFSDYGILHLAVKDNMLFAYVAENGTIYRSQNNGSSWSKVYENPDKSTPFVLATKILFIGSTVFATDASPQGMLRSTDGGNSWHTPNIDLSKSVPLTSIAHIGNTLISSSYNRIGFFYSSNNGSTWSYATNSGANDYVPPTYSMVTFSNTIVALSNPYPLRSRNSGLSWEEWKINFPGAKTQWPNIIRFFVTDSALFVISNEYKLYASTDNGITWRDLNFSFSSNFAPPEIIKFNGALFLVTGEDRKIYRSTDSGITWVFQSQISLLNTRTKFVATNKALFLYAQESNNIYRLSENGQLWERFQPGFMGSSIIGPIVSNGKSMFHAAVRRYDESEKGNVWRSDDNGITWKVINSKITFSKVEELHIKDNYLFAAGADIDGNSGVFRLEIR